MFHRGQYRRESHLQVIIHSIDEKPVPLPGKIVMVGNSGYTGFSDEFSNCDTEGDIHGYGY